MKTTKIIGVILISPFLLMALIITGIGYLICEGLEALGIED